MYLCDCSFSDNMVAIFFLAKVANKSFYKENDVFQI